MESQCSFKIHVGRQFDMLIQNRDMPTQSGEVCSRAHLIRIAFGPGPCQRDRPGVRNGRSESPFPGQARIVHPILNDPGLTAPSSIGNVR